MNRHIKRKFRRGDIYLCEFVDSGGSVQSGLRPAMVIQNNKGNYYSTTLIVSPITSIIKKKELPTHVLLGEDSGLPENSMVMLEQIQTIDKNIHVREHIGFVKDQSLIRKIDKALATSLAIYEKKDIA